MEMSKIFIMFFLLFVSTNIFSKNLKEFNRLNKIRLANDYVSQAEKYVESGLTLKAKKKYKAALKIYKKFKLQEEIENILIFSAL